jgi:uridine kinase
MILHIDLINERAQKDPAAFIRETDAAYRQQLEHIAAYIRATHKQRPIVLISGPSGSGKTTTAQLLELILFEELQPLAYVEGSLLHEWHPSGILVHTYDMIYT